MMASRDGSPGRQQTRNLLMDLGNRAGSSRFLILDRAGKLRASSGRTRSACTGLLWPEDPEELVHDLGPGRDHRAQLPADR